MVGMSSASSALTSMIWKLSQSSGGDLSFVGFDLPVNWQALKVDKLRHGDVEGGSEIEAREAKRSCGAC
jgi:hypothetical protein